jgi:hypothetical protein
VTLQSEGASHLGAMGLHSCVSPPEGAQLVSQGGQCGPQGPTEPPTPARGGRSALSGGLESTCVPFVWPKEHLVFPGRLQPFLFGVFCRGGQEMQLWACKQEPLLVEDPLGAAAGED